MKLGRLIVYPFNIQSMMDNLKICFAVNSIVVLGDSHIKWNKNNHLCTILNIDGSCTGSPIRAGYGGFFEIVMSIIYQVFLVTIKDHLTSFMQSYMLFISVSYWQTNWGF
jgi:hypothetical protein